MDKKYVVRLTAQERNSLETMIEKGKASAYKTRHANILSTKMAMKPLLSQIGWLILCPFDILRNRN